LAWDVKWLPFSAVSKLPAAATLDDDDDDKPQARLGLLAAALGTGELVVYAVPTCSAVTLASGARGEQQSGGASPVLALLPCYRASFGDCLMWTLAWSPQGDRIVAGCADGTLVVWGLKPHPTMQAAAVSPAPARGASGVAVDQLPLLSIRAHQQPIRAVCWAPEIEAGNDATVAAAAMDNNFSVWDLRDIWAPCIMSAGEGAFAMTHTH
jgi:WD40 repeat protein